MSGRDEDSYGAGGEVPVTPDDLGPRRDRAGDGELDGVHHRQVATILRAALEPDDDAVRRLLTTVPEIELRARRARRRALVLPGLAATAAAAVVVGVVLAGRPQAAAPSPPATAPTASAGPTPTPGRPTPAVVPPTADPAAVGDGAVPPLSGQSLLRSVDVGKLGPGRVYRIMGAEITSAVVGLADGCSLVKPRVGWQSMWRIGNSEASSWVVTQDIWQFRTRKATAGVLDRLESAESGCLSRSFATGAQASRYLDPAPVRPAGGRAVVQVWGEDHSTKMLVTVLNRQTVVMLTLRYPEGPSDAEALATVRPTVLTALRRAGIDR